jgi:hypothetical protein
MFFRKHIWHLAMVKCHCPLQRVKWSIVIFTMVGHVFMIEVRLSFDEPFSSPLSFLFPCLKICTSPFINQLCPLSCISINFGYHFFFVFSFNAFLTLFFSILSLNILFHLIQFGPHFFYCYFFFNFIPHHFISFNFFVQFWSLFFDCYFFFNFIPHHFISFNFFVQFWSAFFDCYFLNHFLNLF